MHSGVARGWKKDVHREFRGPKSHSGVQRQSSGESLGHLGALLQKPDSIRSLQLTNAFSKQYKTLIIVDRLTIIFADVSWPPSLPLLPPRHPTPKTLRTFANPQTRRRRCSVATGTRGYAMMQRIQEAQLLLGDRATRKHAKDS